MIGFALVVLAAMVLGDQGQLPKNLAEVVGEDRLRDPITGLAWEYRLAETGGFTLSSQATSEFPSFKLNTKFSGSDGTLPAATP